MRSLWCYAGSAKRRWASACVIAGARASNLPVFRSSSATWRVTALPPARRRDRVEAGGDEDARAHRVPGVWQQRQRRSAMLAAKEFSLLSLFRRGHQIALSAAVGGQRKSSSAGRTYDVGFAVELSHRNDRVECPKMHMDTAARTRNVLFRAMAKSIRIGVQGERKRTVIADESGICRARTR